MKRLIVGVFIITAANLLHAQPYAYPLPDYTPPESNMASREHFRDMKFGMFIHWGIYSLLGDGEWVMYNRKIPYENYKRLAGFFNPQNFDAKKWVELVKSAGMKYITITSRHHDGFSMFNTAASAYDIIDATPYKKDPIKELAEECDKQGIELHFYYSLLDWGRPDYGFGKRVQDGAPANTDWNSYIAFMKKQLTELLTNYPNIKGIWFDGHWDRPAVNWHYDELYSLIHSINPAVLVGNNHHMSPLKGEDFQMFEKDLPGENKTGYSGKSGISDLPLETCETINNSWGFNINDRNYKSVKQIIHLIVNAAGRNANFLLNTGPMPDGNIQPEFYDTLSAVGKWMQQYGETIYGTRGNIIPPQSWGVITSKNKMLYVHILNKVNGPYIFLPGIKNKIVKASLFAGNKAVKFKQQPEGVFIYTDDFKQEETDTVLQLQVQ